jgi:hypothetical protein
MPRGKAGRAVELCLGDAAQRLDRAEMVGPVEQVERAGAHVGRVPGQGELLEFVGSMADREDAAHGLGAEDVVDEGRIARRPEAPEVEMVEDVVD